MKTVTIIETAAELISLFKCRGEPDALPSSASVALVNDEVELHHADGFQIVEGGITATDFVEALLTAQGIKFANVRL